MSYNHEGMAKDFEHMAVKRTVKVLFKSYDDQRKAGK
jgi:hypothetical protein